MSMRSGRFQWCIGVVKPRTASSLRLASRRRVGSRRARVVDLAGRPSSRSTRHPRLATSAIPVGERSQSTGRVMGDIRPSFEGIVAFETTNAAADGEGSALRYHGIDIEELLGPYSFERDWACSSTKTARGTPRAAQIELQDPSGSVMVDLQAGLATLGRGGLFVSLWTSSRSKRATISPAFRLRALSIVAQAAGGSAPAVAELEVGAGGQTRPRASSDRPRARS